MNLLSRGPRVLDFYSNEYFDFIDTNPWGGGGRIAKQYDKVLFDQSVEKTKMPDGPGYQYGLKL